MAKTFKLSGSNLEANIGKIARQADGSVWLTCGESVVLATIVAKALPADSKLDFLPLTVEYRERLSSVGKMPGGFFKREGKLSDSEVLISRIIDRSVRPLFPKGFSKDVQIIVSLMSYDGSFPTESLAVLAASIAIMSSNTDLVSPVGIALCARLSATDNWVVNPTASFLKTAQDKVLVVGTQAGVCMLEANCNFVKDEDIVEVIDKVAMVEIANQIKWQVEIKKSFEILEKDSTKDLFKGKEAVWFNSITLVLPSNYKEHFFAEDKKALKEKMSTLHNEIKTKLADKADEFGIVIEEADVFIDLFFKKHVPSLIIEAGHRFDFRKFDQIRQIDSEVGLLPRTHGSALFTRGQTQAISSITLAATNESQRIETLTDGVVDKHFMLHYNFPPFSTGEVKPLRGVGRREIGHGYLAEKSLKQILPDMDVFKYTVRILVDVLESNGSSSMATVCAAMLAMMDAGIPVKKTIAGIAMGLLRGEDGSVQVISDITGTEDGYGTMDFKVVGDEDTLVAIQVDVKGFNGLTGEILAKTLNQAKEGRRFILKKMKECLSEPRKELKESAPRCFTLKIQSSKIGMVIGPSGKNIKQITAETGTQIEIADDGVVAIFAIDNVAARRAESWIRALVGDIKSGSSYQGKISKILPELGIFVAIVPGKDGLVHISSIDRKKRADLETLFKVGGKLDVIVTNVDMEGRVKLVAPELEAHEGSID